jgi:hypothetical protein
MLPLKHLETKRIYEIRPRKDHRGVDLISDVLPRGNGWFYGPERSHPVERPGGKNIFTTQK